MKKSYAHALSEYFLEKNAVKREKLMKAWKKIQQSLRGRIKRAYPDLGKQTIDRWVMSGGISWVLEKTHKARSHAKRLPSFNPIKGGKFRGGDGKIRSAKQVVAALERAKYEQQIDLFRRVLGISRLEAQRLRKGLQLAHPRNVTTNTRVFTPEQAAAGEAIIVGDSPIA